MLHINNTAKIRCQVFLIYKVFGMSEIIPAAYGIKAQTRRPILVLGIHEKKHAGQIK